MPKGETSRASKDKKYEGISRMVLGSEEGDKYIKKIKDVRRHAREVYSNHEATELSEKNSKEKSWYGAPRRKEERMHGTEDLELGSPGMKKSAKLEPGTERAKAAATRSLQRIQVTPGKWKSNG